MASRRLLAWTGADAHGSTLGDCWPWICNFLRVGLTVEPSVGATMEARACTEEREWQTGRGKLGEEKQHSNLVLGPTHAEKTNNY